MGTKFPASQKNKGSLKVGQKNSGSLKVLQRSAIVIST